MGSGPKKCTLFQGVAREFPGPETGNENGLNTEFQAIIRETPRKNGNRAPARIGTFHQGIFP